MKPWSYAGSWALVTGASAGLGEVFARRLAEREMNLVLTARRAERLAALAAELSAGHGVEILTIPADLARRGEADRVWREATTGRGIDLLVNNAGFGAQGDFAEVDLQRHLDLVEVNCTAPMVLAHLAIAHMRPRGGGGIINVSSIAAFQPVPTLATYAAAKAFVLSLSEALWAENRRWGIRVLALCPGRTPTEFQEVAGTGSAEGAFGFRTPEQVVDVGLAAFERDRNYVVPGVENFLATYLTRALPRSAVTRGMRRVAKRFLSRRDDARDDARP
ncbi:MAG TPA: SDR family oxidoreductase [Candidatus Limnocylindrales bacterium]|nr:SDR family oxidoreductase [Candidatus Limnocylindrales bacterium]